MSAEAPEILLAHYLKTLKLPTFQREHQKLARQCAAEGVDHVGYLARLAEREMIERDRRKVERRIKAASFPVVKSLDSFDFAAIPSSTRCRCWNWRAANGSSGARTSSRSAPAARARPMSPSGSAWPPARRAGGRLHHRRARQRDDGGSRRAASSALPEADGRLQALIIDELGFVPLSKTGAELLFELISQRYERGATLITSNLPFDEWTETGPSV
jgi:DNA replication protein DnaC